MLSALNSLLLAASITAAPAPAPRGLPEPVVPAPFGVNIHFVVPNEEEVDALAAGGFHFIRMDFHWGGIERKKGEYDFSGYDKLVESMSRRGIRCLFILDYGNDLYDKGASPATDECRAAFAAWAGAAARHFAGKGILWEIWNEPNIGFWKPKPNAEDYSKLALAVIKAVRAADPQAFIIGPASSSFPWDFYAVMGERGVFAGLDAVSVHPYRQQNPETALADYARLRALVDHYSPKRHLPIISGEWGYSTAWGGLTEEKQSQYIVRQWLTNLSLDVRPSIWYDWKDDGPDPKEPEHHFGSVTRDLKPKPSYLAAQTLSHTLDGYRFVRRATLASPNDYLLLFRKGKQEAAAVWTTGEKHILHLAMPAGPVPVVQMLGEKQTLTAGAAGLEVEIGPSPQYLFLPAGDAASLAVSWQPAQAITSFAGGAAAGLSVLVENPTAKPLRGTLTARAGEQELGQAKVSLAAGKKATVTVPLRSLPRDRELLPATVELAAPGAGLFASSCVYFAVTNPIRVSILPRMGKAVTLQVENPSGEPLRAVARASAGAVQGKAPVALKAGEKVAAVTVPLPAEPAADAAISAELRDAKGGLLVKAPAARWQVLTPVLPAQGAWKAWTEGDSKVAGTATAEVVPLAAGEVPQAGLTHALRFGCKLDLGWRFGCVAPPEALLQMEGKPTAVGMWVYGDGSGDALRCRFTDSTGQTFQPHYGEITWKGWRFVILNLDAAGAGHWGGANDGVIHYPIHWTALALLDPGAGTAGRQPEVKVTGISLRY